MLEAVLSRMIQLGTLDAQFPNHSRRRFGGTPGPTAAVAIRTRQAERRLLLNPGLALGELYMSGEVEPEGCSIYDLLDVFFVNSGRGRGHPADRMMQRWRTLIRRASQLNPAGRSRRNVAHHYDLNGRLYSLFLDRDRQYSCAYFPSLGSLSPEQLAAGAHATETLEEAQVAKKRHIASKLRLDRPGLEVIDIGCGWGGMALTLARDYGARVIGVTLSTEQLAAARARVAEAGLSDRVKFELIDYRALPELLGRKVDRIVSVGMFEHVGVGHFDTFFRTARRLLKPDGIMLLHAIGRMEGPGGTNAWISKYIFPGGYSPALSEVLPAVERADLWVTDIEILRLHYAETLRHWRRRFAANRDTIASLYDERFCRMFEFYLAASELTFRRSDHMNWQLQVSPSREAVPMTRDYMVETERATAARSMAGAEAGEGGAA